jgi:hypothetical protein
MLIIKPYGRTRTEDNESSGRQRKLVGKQIQLQSEPVTVIAEKNEFLMAQWISIIDKIISKSPVKRIIEGKIRPCIAPTQRQARERIGQAALKFQPALKELEANWKAKIHAYKITRTVSSGDPKDRIKGRSYAKFVPHGIEPEQITTQIAEEIAKKIHDHLNHHALNSKGTGGKGKGSIAHQLGSIAQNVHQADKESGQEPSEVEWQKYFDHHDVVAAIAKAIQSNRPARTKPTLTPKETANTGQSPSDSPRRLTDTATIAKHLFDHFGQVFGQNAKVKDLLNPSHPQHGLWQVHHRIKATYKALFDNASVKRRKNMAIHMPPNKEAMMALVRHRTSNQDLNQLVRLGKVIHYEAAACGQSVRSAWSNIRPNIDKSPYWLSEGQSEIKRSEALVRVFKLSVSHASRTLTDLCQWQEGDIFLNSEDASKKLIPDRFVQRMQTLFGRDQDASDPVIPSAWHSNGQLHDDAQALLEETIDAWAQLRHASFHFKGRDGFLTELTQGLSRHAGSSPSNKVALDTRAKKLWDRDHLARESRIRSTLVGAHVETHLNPVQLEKIYTCITAKDTNRCGITLDLPRLNRVLQRAHNTLIAQENDDQILKLPQPAKREALEQSNAARCQYILLKLVYEQGFSDWLHAKGIKELDKWVKLAIKRTDESAQRLNTPYSDDLPVKARANELWQQHVRTLSTSDALGGMSAIAYFFHQLSAATATEFRVQRHYESDASAAQKQAAFIEKLKCDVVAIAFSKYLQKDFPWLLSDLDPTQSCCVSELAVHNNATPVQLWQQRLYFLLHFVPVGAVSQLQHQLRKWHILSHHGAEHESSSLGQLYASCAQVMVLYLDMHDAKFDGGIAYLLSDEQRKQLEDCFELSEDFQACFPKGSVQDSRIPLRALREMLRFGGIELMNPLFVQHKITHTEFDRWTQLQSCIEKFQKSREDLHQKWIDHPGDFSKQDKEAYGQALKICEEHRHLAHRVRLVDHVQLHRLMMTVLARLTDYAGLWERDLYFVCLALCYKKNIDLTTLFNHEDKEGHNFFDDGRIVEALRKVKKDFQFPLFSEDPSLLLISGSTKLAGELVFIRNHLSHFGMLSDQSRSKSTQLPNLTDEVNKTRQLMAYDRKLKNAVSKSVIEILQREGLRLVWQMHDHTLQLDPNEPIQTQMIKHLGDPSSESMTESMHSKAYTQMVDQLFGNKQLNSQT